MRRAVFLDRDGVINRALVTNGKPHPPRSLNELEILPDVSNAIESLHLAGWLLIVISNQPDVARGTTTIADVEKINQYLLENLALDEIRCCYHDDDDRCICRKPLPGSLIAAAEVYGIDLASSYMVGDRWRDIEAGERAGCITIFLDCRYDEKQPESFNFKVHSLAEAADIILRSGHEEC